MEVLVLGAEGAGKSLLTKHLVAVVGKSPAEIRQSESTIPTVGVEMSNVDVGHGPLVLREVGSSIYSRWDSYYKECRAVIFVVDVADTGSYASTMVLLHEMLSNSVVMTAVPILVALNKLDMVDTATYQTCLSFLDLEGLLDSGEEGREITVVEGSCLAPDHSLCTQIVGWLKSISNKLPGQAVKES